MSKRTRREFLTDAAIAAAGASVAGCFPDVGGEWAILRDGCRDRGALPLVEGTSVVVEVHDTASVLDHSGNFDAAVVESMFEEALVELSGGSAQPWLDIFPDYADGIRIGLKVNCLNGECATSVELTKAIVDSLKDELAISPDNVIVWDRRLDELTAAGFTEQSVGAKVMGTINSTTDSSGPGYEQSYCSVVNGKTTHLSSILTELTDVTINCPVLKSHGVSGVTAAMKNIYGVIDNPGDFHKDLNTALPAIYELTPVRTRCRLNVVDALQAVTIRDTADPPDEWPGRIFVSRDPLATDHHALALVNQLRVGKSYAEIDPELTRWIENAHQAGLGAREIQLTRLQR